MLSGNVELNPGPIPNCISELDRQIQHFQRMKAAEEEKRQAALNAEVVAGKQLQLYEVVHEIQSISKEVKEIDERRETKMRLVSEIGNMVNMEGKIIL